VKVIGAGLMVSPSLRVNTAVSVSVSPLSSKLAVTLELPLMVT
jgi:hypothetical protein